MGYAVACREAASVRITAWCLVAMRMMKIDDQRDEASRR